MFRELGANVSCIGCDPDGLNINEEVGATHIDTLAQAVVTQQADIGIALDGDADRLIMVDSKGRAYNGDELLYALVRDRLSQGTVPGVVGTLMTNYALERRLTELNVGFVRSAVGDRYVLEAMLERGWLLGGEGSGHLICLDRHTTGDGIIAALQILASIRHLSSTLPELLADLDLYPQKMINVPLTEGLDWRTHPKLQSVYAEVQSELVGRGRALIRASGTEPKLRLMVEADNSTLAEQCVQRLAESLAS